MCQSDKNSALSSLGLATLPPTRCDESAIQYQRGKKLSKKKSRSFKEYTNTEVNHLQEII